ncbi:squalene synthase HpnC [Hydrogenophaga sp.]|uniref:squalene synthase HpnC n=1 Tax=Hydrogenophaga sp. TaxID=1904254 RepID=UPI0026373623|nr:squalene synthase HpnC [Hydrogenophaga sp.]MDM7949850.1 squalene synthase HpnC [Hydrogenophaga sp.]
MTAPNPNTDASLPSPSAGVGHYENFPVASWLCPPALRSAVQALYHFARTADDLADEGDAAAEQRLLDLDTYRHELDRCLTGNPPVDTRWPGIFKPLRAAVTQHHLPGPLLHDLISAFEQDVRHTASGHRYADTTELLDYARRSANPVGRLLLHLYGVSDAASLKRSDQICSALQLINFWQDIRVDHARGRHYLPTDALARHGVQLVDFAADAQPEPATQVRMARAVAALCLQAHGLMLEGAPLARRVPGRAGWELRLVVQGGLRTLEKLADCGHRSWKVRPRLRVWDVPVLLWRALWMR